MEIQHVYGYYEMGSSKYENGKTLYMPTNIIQNGICVTVTKGMQIGAFSGMPLYKVVLGEAVQEINEFAFRGSNVFEVVLPSGIQRIEENTFKNAYGLQKITIPDSVTEIGESAFEKCLNLQKMQLHENITKIGKNAFRECGNLKEVVLSEGLETIGEWAFYQCDEIIEIVLPDSVTQIGEWAFYSCNKLESVTLSKELKKIGDRAFYETALTTLVLPEKLEEIGESAFYSLMNLTTLDIPASVKTIGENAFTYIPFTKITGGEGLKSVGENAFTYSQIEESVYGNVRYKFLQALGPVSTDVEWIQLKPCSLVVSQAFKDCAKLTTVFVGENTTFSDRVFLNTNTALRVMFDGEQPTTGSSDWRIIKEEGTQKYYLGGSYTVNGVANTKLGSITENVDLTTDGYIYKSAEILGYVGGQTQLTLPSKIEETTVFAVAENAFLARTDITSVAISGIERINAAAFASCGNLQTVTLTGVDAVGEGAFMNCTSLQTLTLGEGVRVIGVGAFMNCTALQSVSFPASAFTIQQMAFYGSGLKNATFATGNTAWYVLGGTMYTEIVETLDFSDGSTAAQALVAIGYQTYMFGNKAMLDQSVA